MLPSHRTNCTTSCSSHNGETAVAWAPSRPKKKITTRTRKFFPPRRSHSRSPAPVAASSTRRLDGPLPASLLFFRRRLRRWSGRLKKRFRSLSRPQRRRNNNQSRPPSHHEEMPPAPNHRRQPTHNQPTTKTRHQTKRSTAKRSPFAKKSASFDYLRLFPREQVSK